MRPPEKALKAIGYASPDHAVEELGERSTDGSGRVSAGPPRYDEERLRQQREEHQGRDEQQYDSRLFLLGQVESEPEGRECPTS